MTVRTRMRYAGLAAVGLVLAVGGRGHAQGIAAPETEAQPSQGECSWGSNRELGGHTFLSAALVPSALITSHVGISVGAALNEVPNFTLRGIDEVDIEQLYFTQLVDGGVRLFDRVGLFATLRGSAAASTKVRSLVVRTGEYLLGGDAGVIVKLFQVPAIGTQVSVRGAFGTSTGKILTLLPLLQALEAAPGRTVEDVLRGRLGELLLTPVSIQRWTARVSAAQPLTALFSVQAAAGLQFEDMTLEAFDLGEAGRADIELSVVRPEFALAVTADADPLGLPFGAMLEYRVALPDEENETLDASASETEHTAAIGFYYTGRTDVQVGLVAISEWGTRTTSVRGPQGSVDTAGDPRRVGGVLTLQYFW